MFIGELSLHLETLSDSSEGSNTERSGSLPESLTDGNLTNEANNRPSTDDFVELSPSDREISDTSAAAIETSYESPVNWTHLDDDSPSGMEGLRTTNDRRHHPTMASLHSSVEENCHICCSLWRTITRESSGLDPTKRFHEAVVFTSHKFEETGEKAMPLELLLSFKKEHAPKIYQTIASMSFMLSYYNGGLIDCNIR